MEEGHINEGSYSEHYRHTKQVTRCQVSRGQVEDSGQFPCVLNSGYISCSVKDGFIKCVGTLGHLK